jgi:hypothetical protein
MARRWQVLLVTAVGVFMTFLDVTIVNIAFPDIRESFPDSSLAQLSWILNAYAIVFAAALVPAENSRAVVTQPEAPSRTAFARSGPRTASPRSSSSSAHRRRRTRPPTSSAPGR